MLAPIAWRTPPRHYGPWELVVSLLTEGLVSRGVDVTLFATADSKTQARLHGVCPRPYEEDKEVDPKVWECLHISELFERAAEYDLIHNHFDFLPLTYSRLVSTPVLTTIQGFSSPKILPVYKKYNGRVFYVSISNSNRSPELDYVATVYHGIDLKNFTFRDSPGDYLLFFARIHHDKGAKEAIEIARKADMKLIMAGIIQDKEYFDREVRPLLQKDRVEYLGSVGPKMRDELLGGAYALLHPINFEEPFGLSVIESMACGTPVVAFKKGSMPELIRDGENGFLVDDVKGAVEAIQKIDAICRKECRSYVQQNFTMERMVDDYLRVYNEVLEASKLEGRRPWGFYEVLSDRADHKVKRICVSPGKRLSLQRHRRRSEHWHVVRGEGLVMLDDKQLRLGKGDSVDIPLGVAHRAQNPKDETLVFIEVQQGDYFGEDDIERLEDDFGRV